VYVRENERRALRRAAAVVVGFSAAVVVVTIVGVALASWLDGGDARAQVAAAYTVPDELPVCGSLGDLAAPQGVSAAVQPTGAPGEYVGIRLAGPGGGDPVRPLSVVVARGSDIVGEFRGTPPADPAAVVLAGCSADPAADTDPTVPGGRPLLPPGDYEVVVVFGEAVPPGDRRVYASPAFTALRLPLTVVDDGP
jgi:hypothetical protein